MDYNTVYSYLRRRRRLCFRCGLFVCLFVCLSVGLLANLWTDYDEIFWRGRAWLKDQVIQFWWRSGSRFGSGSPKSEIRILRIGGGLCCLSISSWLYEYKRAPINYRPYIFLDQWRGWRPLVRFSEHRGERLVTLRWSKIIGRYNTPDWRRKQAMK